MIEENYGLVLVLCFPTLLVAGVALFRCLRDAWRRHRWIPVPGTIVEFSTSRDGLETVESMARERGMWWIDYRYRTLGATRVGRTRIWYGPRPQVGRSVTVYVNPKTWKKSALPTTPQGFSRPLLLAGGVIALTLVLAPAVEAFSLYHSSGGGYGGGFGARISPFRIRVGR